MQNDDGVWQWAEGLPEVATKRYPDALAMVGVTDLAEGDGDINAIGIQAEGAEHGVLAVMNGELFSTVHFMIMEVDSGEQQTFASEQVDLRGFDLPVIAASEQELAQHDDLLAQLDKASNNQTVWRKLENSVA